VNSACAGATQLNRLSGQSCESGVASLWPSTHCIPVSQSRSSHSGLDWLDENAHGGAPVSVNDLIQQGHKVNAWTVNQSIYSFPFEVPSLFWCFASLYVKVICFDVVFISCVPINWFVPFMQVVFRIFKILLCVASLVMTIVVHLCSWICMCRSRWMSWQCCWYCTITKYLWCLSTYNY